MIQSKVWQSWNIVIADESHQYNPIVNYVIHIEFKLHIRSTADEFHSQVLTKKLEMYHLELMFDVIAAKRS